MEQKFMLGQKVLVVLQGRVESVENVDGIIVYQIKKNENRAFVTETLIKEIE